MVCFTAMLLGGDLGATKTRIGLFRRTGGRPELVDIHEFPTREFSGLSPILARVLETTGTRPDEIEAACVGVAGPIIDQVAYLTNVPWHVHAREVAAATGIERLWLLNDVEAMAYGVPALTEEERHPLQTGVANPDGNMCLLTAGTGLGQAILVRHRGELFPCPSEGGHADFAARTPREVELLQELTRRYGRAHTEYVVSGPGLVNLLRFTSHERSPLLEGTTAGDRDLPPKITSRGLAGSDPHCVEALQLFVAAFGSAAANFALQSVATAGVFLGGGIPPKILDAFEPPLFLDAFLRKPPMEDMLERMPVHIVLNPHAGLLGAATYAATMTQT